MFSSESVTRTAISMRATLPRSSPVISQSIHTRLSVTRGSLARVRWFDLGTGGEADGQGCRAHRVHACGPAAVPPEGPAMPGRLRPDAGRVPVRHGPPHVGARGRAEPR